MRANLDKPILLNEQENPLSGPALSSNNGPVEGLWSSGERSATCEDGPAPYTPMFLWLYPADLSFETGF